MALVAEDEFLPLYLISDGSLAGALYVDEIVTAFVPLLRAVASGASCFTRRVVMKAVPKTISGIRDALTGDKLTNRELAYFYQSLGVCEINSA